MATSSHSRRVLGLYKKVLRHLDSWFVEKHKFLYEMSLMRARFEQNKDVKDPTKIEKLLADAEKEFFLKQHPIPKIFPESPGGCAYQREVIPPDWVLDYWHPIEKAAYPHYFATREKRKKEYLELWDKAYGKPKSLQEH